MRLRAPQKAPAMTFEAIYGEEVTLGKPGNRRTLLCFFRDPACPFCNFRVYELTAQYDEWQKLGLDVIAVFSAEPDEVKRFAAKQPRPFPVIADTDSSAYERYGIESSRWGKYKGILTRIPTLLKGLKIVGLAGLKTSNLMPADFLIDEDGMIAEAWYGEDAGDRIPLGRVRLFAARGTRHREEAKTEAAA